MTMCRDDDTLYAPHPFANITNQVAELQWNRITNGVRNVQRGRAGLNDRLEHLEEKFRFSAGRVFRRKFDILAKRARQTDRLSSLFKALLARNAQLVLQMNVRCRQKYV